MYYIGFFQVLTDQQESDERNRRHGDFSMLIDAGSTEQALELFRRRLITLRTSSSFFTGKCKVYITQLLEFEQVPRDEAVMLNLKSYGGDPILPFISCIVPTEQSDACSIHDWQHNHPTTEGQRDNMFIQFD